MHALHMFRTSASSAILFLTILSGVLLRESSAQTNYTYDELKPCALGTAEISKLGPDDELEPCIIFKVKPNSFVAREKKKSFTITMVQVTPAHCGNHRDGAVTGVQSLNDDNGGKGVAIGFNQDHYVSFELISVVAGNEGNLPKGEYERRHVQLLNSLLESTGSPYIVGTCSFASAMEKKPALDHRAFVMAQVGPPGFYMDDNPWVFGFHINSDTYPLPNVQSLSFLAQEKEGGPASIPVKVIYRTKSEFFYSTCRSAIDKLTSFGFTDLEEFLYDHADDHDEDGDINQFDEDYLIHLADQACPPGSGDVEGFHPALFLCTLTEQDIILDRLLDNGCRPISTWVTAATWGWATSNPNKVPYFQGGGQWHAAFTYSDRYFKTGLELIIHNEEQFGYLGNYDQVVSYSIPVLYSQHLQAAYRVVDSPNPLLDFNSKDKREQLRRDMMVLNVESLFGPISFNEYQRNIGRGAAGTQWLPTNGTFHNALVAPFLQAEAATFIPARSALPCHAGQFANESARVGEGSILASGCELCPVDTFTPSSSYEFECRSCPEGSATDEIEGAHICVIRDDNLIHPGIVAIGYLMVFISWALSLSFIGWLLKNRNDPVVKVSQIEFLLLICVGCMISSSTIIALTFQAETDQDTSTASAACAVAPFLYAVGWVLQYSSLSAKTLRLFAIMRSNKQMKRIKITFIQMLTVVAVVFAIELAILIPWTVLSPLQYQRSEEGINIDEANGVMTINTVGRCVASNPKYPMWYFAAPLMTFHVVLVLITNILLYNVKEVSDRYQEQKYIGFASTLMFEILIVGIPVIVSVSDNPLATFIVIIGIIALDDIGILCFIFVPKIKFKKKGLQQGIGVGESIMKESQARASTREAFRNSCYSIGSVSKFSKLELPVESESASFPTEAPAPTPATAKVAKAKVSNNSWGAIDMSRADFNSSGIDNISGNSFCDESGSELSSNQFSGIGGINNSTNLLTESIIEETEDDVMQEQSSNSVSSRTSRGATVSSYLPGSLHLSDDIAGNPGSANAESLPAEKTSCEINPILSTPVTQEALVQAATSQTNLSPPPAIQQNLIQTGPDRQLPVQTGPVSPTSYYAIPVQQPPLQANAMPQVPFQATEFQRASEPSTGGAMNIMKEHERMMQMTFKLMEEHQRMMRATTEMMYEHERLKRQVDEQSFMTRPHLTQQETANSSAQETAASTTEQAKSESTTSRKEIRNNSAVSSYTAVTEAESEASD